MHYKDPISEVLEAAYETCERLKSLSEDLMKKEINLLINRGFTVIRLEHGSILVDPEVIITFDIVDNNDSVIIGNFLSFVKHDKFVIFLSHL